MPVSLEVKTSFAVVFILAVLPRAVEIRGLEVRRLAANEVFELADSEARVVTVRLRDGKAVFKDSCSEDCVTLKIDPTVDPSEIDFGMKVDTTVTGDVLGTSVVNIISVWKLEV